MSSVVFGYALLTGLVYYEAREKPLPVVDAIVVLGASQTGGVPSPVFQARLDRAVDLYYQHKAPKIILTGGVGQGERVSEAQVGRSYLMQKGIESEALLQENTGTTTWESLNNVTSITKENYIQTIIVVSDGFHLLRAKVMAQDLGFTAYTAPALASPIARNKLTQFRHVLRENIVLTLYLFFAV